MILGIVTKQPNESWPLAADFELRFESAETITGVVATARNLGDGTDATDGFLSLTQAFPIRAQVRLNAVGLDGERYRVQFRVVTTLGNTYEAEVDVDIREF